MHGYHVSETKDYSSPGSASIVVDRSLSSGTGADIVTVLEMTVVQNEKNEAYQGRSTDARVRRAEEKEL